MYYSRPASRGQHDSEKTVSYAAHHERHWNSEPNCLDRAASLLSWPLKSWQRGRRRSETLFHAHLIIRNLQTTQVVTHRNRIS